MNNFWLDNHPFFRLNNIDTVRMFVENYQSPCFVYSTDVIARQYNNLKKSLPDYFNIFYAQKSNPHPDILRCLNLLGSGCDTASEGEVNAALSAGFPSSKIIMTGPAKTNQEITYAINNSVLSINIESLQEAHSVSQISKQTGNKQNVMLRINPTFEAGEKNRIIGGMGVSKFGIDADQIPEVIAEIMKLKNINIHGIHIFNSSQILDWRRIYQNTKDVVEMAMKISKQYNLELKYIDAGGGFGIPYEENEKELDIENLGNKLNELIRSSEYSSYLSGISIIFEPGRYLSGQCGIYLTKVLYTKESGGKNIALVDGGIHHMLRPALIGHRHPIINLTAIIENRSKTKEYIVAGPLCTSFDQFDDKAILNEVNPGDVLAILNAGAYGYTESMPLFLSHKPASEIFIN